MLFVLIGSLGWWRAAEAAGPISSRTEPVAAAEAVLRAEVRRALEEINNNYGQAGALDWTQAKALIAQREKRTQELVDRLAQLGPGGARAMAAGYSEASGTRAKLLLVRALGKINDAQATDEIQGLLGRDDTFSLRKEMVVALGRRQEPAAAQALAAVLANSDDVQLRFAAGQALSGRASALPVLAERLQREAHSEVCKELVHSIGLVGTPAAMNVLASVAQNQSDVAVRKTAIQELGRSFGASALEVLDRLLNNSDEGIRKSAVNAVARVKTDAATALLRRTAVSDSSVAIRDAAVAALPGQLP